jgi:hypothetical protein
MQKLDDPRVSNTFNVELRNKFDIWSNAADLDDRSFRGILEDQWKDPDIQRQDEVTVSLWWNPKTQRYKNVPNTENLNAS